VLLALSTGHKVGLFTVAAIFIAFALASSFLFPRLNPSFPGRRLGLFLGAVAVLTIAMLGAVEVFAGEEHEAEGAASETTTQSTETQPPPGTTTAPAPAGDPEAGKAVFTSAGCAACHTLSAANASGKVGPDLDTALKGKDHEFIRQSILDPNAEIAPGYQAGIMPQNFKQTLSKKQLDDLVALLSQQE
jgi:mono/diheme cytochrome c family protein